MCWSFNMYYNSCGFSGDPWRAHRDHCRRLKEIFKKDEERYQKDLEKSKALKKEFQNLLNKSTQEG